jgi:hypothetical protein
VAAEDDFLLEWLAYHAEHGFNMPITLAVGGVIITGELVTEDQYFEGISHLFTDEESQEFYRSLPNALDEGALRQLDEGADPQEIQERREEMKRDFIHLRDTYILVGGEFSHFERVFWRGKLSSIDGFWLGRPAAQDG